MVKEQAVTFKCNNDSLLGIVHHASNNNLAVLIVVGGPQYRAGSHRQFVQLSRFLAKNGVPSMRFDYRGMGDSQGKKQPFDQICDDIKAACDSLIQTTKVANVVIWGLCDAASAALKYAHKDQRVKGLLLLNPWMTNDQAMGQAMLSHYYVRRLFSKDFWKKLLRGNVKVSASINELKGHAKTSLSNTQAESGSYQQDMLIGITKYRYPIALILSGQDLTAKEFELQVFGNKKWKSMIEEKAVVHRLEVADHTFSSREHKKQVEKISIEFVNSIQHYV